jgi:hypothetical protein
MMRILDIVMWPERLSQVFNVALQLSGVSTNKRMLKLIRNWNVFEYLRQETNLTDA